MDVFGLRDQLITDYSAYVESFINIRDARIRGQVEDEMQKGLLWPDPLLQLNPSFEPGLWIDDLVSQNVLHPECSGIFRIKPKGEPSRGLRLHKHQADAIEAAQSGESYILTTGTGSGKSLAYIIPIVNHILRRGSGKGIQAIVVYPMNALANSQFNELEKFLCHGYPQGQPPVTFRSYTGQNERIEREEIIASPPDILLTNYVMLELLLTRPFEKHIIDAAKGLQFLVLDELHTYRGRQGADVALLVRRVRDVCKNSNLQCVGTSATLAEGGTFSEQQEAIATVAGKLFGTMVKSKRVIGETLRRATPALDNDDQVFRTALTARVQQPEAMPTDFANFVTDPLASWIESTFGLMHEPQTGRLCRAIPQSITGEHGAAQTLSDATGIPVEQCVKAIQHALLAGYHVINPETNFPVFAFRLHQFISRGDTVYASPEVEGQRYITLQGQQYVPGDEDRNRVLLPVAFCRACGQEYYVVRKTTDAKSGEMVYLRRDLTDRNAEGDEECGFLYRNSEDPWPADTEEQLGRVPEDWLESKDGARQIKRDAKKKLPVEVTVNALGQECSHGNMFWYLKSPFPFCLHCGVSYNSRTSSDFGKLSSLSSEGRSTATTILSLACYRSLRDDQTLEKRARKLLSFTDNRQDASLQAGHFNDFVQVGLLRGALYHAVASAGSIGLTHDELPVQVFKSLNLPRVLYALDPDVKYTHQIAETDKAMRDVLGYQVYQDLRRGWRITSPNLEQCGLLEIQYASLDEVCENDDEWVGAHSALANTTTTQRCAVVRVLLDFLRRELAINADYLDVLYQERIQQRSSQQLIEPWAIDLQEIMTRSVIAYPRSARKGRDSGLFVSSRGRFGSYLRRPETLTPHDKLTLDDTQHIIADLFVILTRAGLLVEAQEARNEDEVPGYQLRASSLIWYAGDGTKPFIDPLNIPRQSSEGGKANSFFVDFYQHVAGQLQGIEAREHTAQVPYDERQDREDRFREGDLAVLFCSPTMELGVDIAQLNAVNMRNIPPTPANYAQRSGRAGRSGQPALVFAYCTTGSPHDQYFFKRPERMVSGSVTPPRIDLANEDLVRAHVHAVWLAETGLSLGTSLKDILSIEGENPTLEVLPSVQQSIANPAAKTRAAHRMRAIFTTMADELTQADWFTPDWLTETLNAVESRFDEACERWRGLYRAAITQRDLQHKIEGDNSRSAEDRAQAKRLRAEAEAQRDLLLSIDNIAQSDFYSYRYFASEGFLPGYNFPRLPLSAYIPGRQKKKNDRKEYLSRPRFVAISEFGPRSIIYHEGSQYVINKVILPVGEDVLTTSVKLCPMCGYLHPINGGAPGLDRCEFCHAELDLPMTRMFRLQNVATRRRDRITSDEEERQRMGYEIKTSIRFSEHGSTSGRKVGSILSPDGEEIFRLTYGQAATIWRINLGWRRRTNKELNGFLLDVERGIWAKSDQENDPVDDPMTPRQERVIPFVEDRRNCLLIQPVSAFSADPQEHKRIMASLQPALKTAVQAMYQLEDDELATEPMPTSDDRRMFVLYEAAEGGAGVLRQLLDDRAAMARVAQEALRICHFDPETGADLLKAPRAKEECVAACYDCLMSYTNQPDHELLDRKLIKDILLQLAGSTMKASPVSASRAEHLAQLKSLCDSDLERKWLDLLEKYNLRLPDTAQAYLEAGNTKPDFLYRDEYVAVYIDGPIHDQPDVQAEDKAINERLFESGYRVIRFHYQADWEAILRESPDVFGNLQ
ncbi:MAG: DEAD/DEAH box helicase [Armatimonadota bacterium]